MTGKTKDTTSAKAAGEISKSPKGRNLILGELSDADNIISTVISSSSERELDRGQNSQCSTNSERNRILTQLHDINLSENLTRSSKVDLND
ncbi:Hypothetical protein SRAE_0000050200 [Strongyloides ratti]|uniref:Uncharacterized protein n=1 Tax=Strongyloides ratti TaxID=34506 RepID=A0A090KVC7_STRRB|nr:Hypothetical protein SRAE_0000050200 [Strongyloides ratti]CEF61376.1 Hypothetical protein SRAE_0000050200 [Strongyloides ratti]